MSVKGFLQQHYRRYDSPKTCRCGPTLLTQCRKCKPSLHPQGHWTRPADISVQSSHQGITLGQRHNFIAQHDWLGKNLQGIQSSRNNLKYVWCVQWHLIYCSLRDALSIMRQSKAVYRLQLQQSVSIIFNQSIHPSISAFYCVNRPSIHPLSASFSRSEFENTTSDQF